MSPLLFKKACVVFISTKITGLKTVLSPWFPYSIFEHLIFKKLSFQKSLALVQIILRLFSEQHTGYMQSNPLGTAGSLRASGVNKRTQPMCSDGAGGMDPRSQVVTSRASLDSMVPLEELGLRPDLFTLIVLLF